MPLRSRTRATSRRAIFSAVSAASGRKFTMRSMRLRNSGRNQRPSSRRSASRSGGGGASRPKPTGAGRVTLEPMFDVMAMIVRRKSAIRPWASVSRPASKSCRHRS
jgi:hypothetical protein